MENGTSQTLKINSTAIKTKYNVTNVARVNCTEDEWNYTNNVDNASTRITVKTVKTASEDEISYHENVTYNLTIINDGDDIYRDNLTINDTLDEGLEFLRTVNITGADVVKNQTVTGQTITWVISNIKPHSSAVILIEVKANAISERINNFTLKTPYGNEIKVNTTIVVTPLVDVSVTKAVDKKEYKVNETAIWTITVSNAYNGTNATNVTLKDILPKEFEFVSASASIGEYNNTTGIWYIGDMENGTSQTLKISSKAITPKDNITNTATVNCTEEEWNYTNNVANASTKIVPVPHKNASTVDPYYHENVTYDLTVINYGDSIYRDNVTVIDSLEEGLVFIETIKITGADIVKNETVNGQTITWVLTNITANGNATITIKVKANAIYEKINNLTIKTPGGTEQTVNTTINITPIVDVSVTKASDKKEYKVNETAIWTITVTNAYNGTNASNVNLSDILPKEFEFVSYNATKGKYNSTTGIWTIGTMQNGTSATLRITSKAITPKYNITNIAKVNCTEEEWNYTNNVANATVNIVPVPVKTVDTADPFYHENVTYNLTVINYGDAVYTDNLTITDSLEEGLEFIETVSITGADLIGEEKVDGQTITWVITNISTSNATITVKVQANAVGLKLNNFTLNTPQGTSETVNVTINIKPYVDVSVTKASDKEEYFIDDIAVWTINVYNAANGTNATNVVLKDLLPFEFEFINYTATTGEYDANSGVWKIGFMENGTSETLTINSLAIKVASEVTNIANVSCSETEWNYTNNVANKTVEVVDIPDINKTANETTPNYHDIVEYNLTIENTGNYTYENNLTAIDSLPEGLEFIETVSITGADSLKEIVDGQTITWTITNIPAKSVAVITVKVKANAIGDLTNNFTIIGPKGTNKTVNCTITPQPIVDLSTTKTSDKDVYFIDDTAIWTITVTNAYNGTNATNVVIDELFPTEFDIINWTTTKGTYDPSALTWKIDFMENGTTETLIITSLATELGAFVNNPVNVTSDEKDWNLSNNPSNKTVKVIDLPDPKKTVNNATPFYSKEVVYTLTVKNTGNATYTNNLNVIDSLPKGLEFVKTVSITGAKLIKEVKKGQVITWTITNIAANSKAVIKVRVKANALGNLTNNLTIVGPKGTNKTVNCTITPVPWADLAVEKTNDHVGVNCHNTTTVFWTVKVVNNGPNTAVNAIAKDILPEGLIYISDDSNGKYDWETGIWNIGNLAKGKSVKLTIETIVDALDVRINNRVVVSSDTYDPDLTNNRDNSSIKVISVADLALTKTANVTKAWVGENISYNITVINKGPDTAVNARVYDLLPKELKLNGFNVTKGSFDPKKGLWTIGDLEYGEEVSMMIDAMVLKSGKIINKARVESDTFDPDLSNNNDTAIVTVIDNYTPGIPMLPTGNPLVFALLSLLAIVGITLKRKS